MNGNARTSVTLSSLSSWRKFVIAVRYSEVLHETLYRPSERGVKNELIVHCVGAYLTGATASWSPTVAVLLVTLCYVDKYKVQTGNRLACGPCPLPLELDTTAIDIIRVATGVTR